MQLKPEQISRIIRSQIKYYENAIEQTETGTVTMVGDGIARAAGLDNCMAGELVQFESGAYGMAQNGKTAEQIIRHYFQNVEIAQVWE